MTSLYVQLKSWQINCTGTFYPLPPNKIKSFLNDFFVDTLSRVGPNPLINILYFGILHYVKYHTYSHRHEMIALCKDDTLEFCSFPAAQVHLGGSNNLLHEIPRLSLYTA